MIGFFSVALRVHTPLVLLGFTPTVVLTALFLNLLYQFWLHADWIPRLGWLEYVLNTPSSHRVHHARNTEYLDAKNKRTPCTVTFNAVVPPFGSLPEGYRNQVLLVTVNVSWTSDNLQHKRSMQTYVARQGMNSYVSIGG